MLPVLATLDFEPRTADSAKSGHPAAAKLRHRPLSTAAVRPNLAWPSNLDPSAQIRFNSSQT